MIKVFGFCLGITKLRKLHDIITFNELKLLYCFKAVENEMNSLEHFGFHNYLSKVL